MKRNYPVLTLDGITPNARILTNDKAISGGLAFLIGELEKRDEKLHEPLTSITWPRDMPVRTGGGLVDTVSAYDVSYATTGGSNGGMMGTQTNDLPIMQADISKEVFKTLMWGHVLKVPMIDQEKLHTIGRSLDDILDKGIHLAHDKKIDESVYVGFQAFGTYGLVNSPVITVVAADPHTPSGTDTSWFGKTPDEILADVNKGILETWSASEYDLSGMANHILIPPQHYAYLVKTKVGVTGDKSILTFLMENNIGKDQGRELFIAPSRWCEGAGAGGTDRMVCYANDKDRVRFDMTAPIRRMFTQPDATQIAYLTPYIAQWSEVQWIYRQTAMYIDGI